MTEKACSGRTDKTTRGCIQSTMSTGNRRMRQAGSAWPEPGRDELILELVTRRLTQLRKQQLAFCFQHDGLWSRLAVSRLSEMALTPIGMRQNLISHPCSSI